MEKAYVLKKILRMLDLVPCDNDPLANKEVGHDASSSRSSEGGAR